MTEVPLDHRHRHPAWINQEAQVWRKSWMRGRRDILRIVARMARFFAMRPVALAAVGAGNEDRAPASGSVSGQSAAGLARFVVRVGMHHHQYRNLRHCPIIAHRRPRG